MPCGVPLDPARISVVFLAAAIVMAWVAVAELAASATLHACQAPPLDATPLAIAPPPSSDPPVVHGPPPQWETWSHATALPVCTPRPGAHPVASPSPTPAPAPPPSYPSPQPPSAASPVLGALILLVLKYFFG